jgi:predicted small lipoprotein YifL
MTRRQALAVLLAAVGALPLAACGRKGQPELPEDADPKAPRRYPTRGY